MAKIYGDYKESVKNGESVEEQFMKALKKKFDKCILTTSTKWENKNKHIDVTFQLGKCNATFDVKSQKKVNRSDSDTSIEYTWVELQNNFGAKGWAYGDEKYIAFEWNDTFIIVDRLKLLDLTNKNKLPDIIYENKDMTAYCQYQRRKWGNQDICVLTPIEDIIGISHMILEK